MSWHQLGSRKAGRQGNHGDSRVWDEVAGIEQWVGAVNLDGPGNAGLEGTPVGTPYANVTYAFAVDFDAGLFWGRNLGSGTQYWNGSSSADPVTATGGITFSAGGANWCMFTTFSNNGDSTTMNLVRQLYNRGIGANGNREIRELSEGEHRSAGSQWPWARSAAQGSGRLPDGGRLIG